MPNIYTNIWWTRVNPYSSENSNQDAKLYCNSEVKCLVDMSFLKEVSQKSFVFELQSFIFEGRLAEMLRFGASKLHF